MIKCINEHSRRQNAHSSPVITLLATIKQLGATDPNVLTYLQELQLIADHSFFAHQRQQTTII